MSFELAAPELASISAVICAELEVTCEWLDADGGESALAAAIANGVAQIALCLRPLQMDALELEMAEAFTTG